MTTRKTSLQARIEAARAAVSSAYTPLTLESPCVSWTLDVEPEHIPVEGYLCATDDPEQDAADVAAVIERLDRGDIEAWCCLVVTVTYTDDNGDEHTARNTLGACSLNDEYTPAQCAEDHGMAAEALAELNDKLRSVLCPPIRLQRVVETKYLGPTDKHMGGRVRARHVTTRKTVTIPWEHAVDAYENHAAAAAMLLDGRPDWGASVDGGGYLFGRNPR